MKVINLINKKASCNKILIIFYLLSCAFVFYQVGSFGDTRFTSDFDHYHSFWYRFTDIPSSSFSKELFNESLFADPDYLADMMTNPIYSLFSTFPIVIFGSPILSNCIGISLGIFYINIMQKVAFKIFPELPTATKILFPNSIPQRFLSVGEVELSQEDPLSVDLIMFPD